MGKKIITFGDVENKKLKFCQHKNLISIYNVNIEFLTKFLTRFVWVKMVLNILLSTKMIMKSLPLCVIFPKMSLYRKYFDETKICIYLIKNDELLEIYNDVWDSQEWY